MKAMSARELTDLLEAHIPQYRRFMGYAVLLEHDYIKTIEKLPSSDRMWLMEVKGIVEPSVVKKVLREYTELELSLMGFTKEDLG